MLISKPWSLSGIDQGPHFNWLGGGMVDAKKYFAKGSSKVFYFISDETTTFLTTNLFIKMQNFAFHKSRFKYLPSLV